MAGETTGVEEYYFYGVNGERQGIYAPGVVDTNTGNIGWYRVSLESVVPKGLQANRDRVGSVMTSGGATRYYPYGEESVVTAADRDKFGTYQRDTTGLDYADQRYYAAATGRFMTADPFVASGGPANPGSWNRYTYVEGDPINFNDPAGLAKATLWIETPPVTVTAPFIGVPLMDIVGNRRAPGDHNEEAGTFITQIQFWEDQADDAVSELTNDAGEEGNNFLRFADCAWESFRKHFGLTVATGVSGVFATPISKKIVPPFRQIGSPTTNLLSVLGHFVEVNIPRIGVAGRATTNLLRVAGRLNPYLALGLAAVDATVITREAMDCYKKDDEEK